MIEPPYSADTRAKGWRFELDYEQIEQSTTWARTKPEARPWLLMLWLVSWKQVPCGSWPDDEEAIAGAIGIPDELWAKHRGALMRGWTKAADGRLYHDTIAARVLAMIEKREKDNARKGVFDAKSKLVRIRDGCACVYCGATKYLSLDHLVPFSRGGSGDESNLVTACRKCNATKGARTPDEAGLSFVNKAAERLWHALRPEGNASVTREARAPDDTYHRPPTTSPNGEVGGAAQSATPTPPPAFDGQNAEVLNGKAIVPLALGWELPDEWGVDAEALGWKRNEVLYEAEKFRQYWTVGKGAGTRRKVKSWRQTWSNWLGRAAERRATR